MNNYITDYQKSKYTLGGGMQRYFATIYGYVASALLITALGALMALTFDPITRLLFRFDAFGGFAGYTGLGMVVSFAPFLIAMYLSVRIQQVSFTQSKLLFGAYALLTGASLACLGFYYTIESLHKTFLITSVTFGAMSFFGYTTNKDLTSAGAFCSTALLGIVISSVVNIFFQSEAIDFVTSFVGVIIFTLFIAYNVQRLKVLYYEVQGGAASRKVALMGAFSLYLNFLNLFLYALRFLGERRRR